MRKSTLSTCCSQLFRFGLLASFVFLWASCGTTPDDIHRWGARGQVERVRAELRKAPNQENRVAIAVELGAAHFPWAIPELVALSQDPSADVRLAAVEALGQYAGREVYSAILERTADDNRNVVSAAERILRTWGSESVYVLLESLTHRDYRVRVSAVQVLGRMGDPTVGEPLMERARQDDHSIVRREAVKALGNLGFQDAKPLLYAIRYGDSNQEVCLEAERALKKIGGTVFGGTIAVLPMVSPEESLAPCVASLEARLRESIVKENLCDVLMTRPYSGQAPEDANQMATEWGRQLEASQVAYVSAQREGNRVRLTITRIEVSSGRLLQQETLVGFQTDTASLVEELVGQFVQRFR